MELLRREWLERKDSLPFSASCIFMHSRMKMDTGKCGIELPRSLQVPQVPGRLCSLGETDAIMQSGDSLEAETGCILCVKLDPST